MRVESTSGWVTSAVVVLLGGVLLAAPTTAFAQRRVALVIGNAAYVEPEARLTNPVNDAGAMAEVLKELDFDVLQRQDLDREGMDRTVNEFIGELRAGDVAVFYYSGHGLELDDGRNYLAPVDFSSSYDRVQARNRSLQADEVQARMEAAGAGTRIVILDACRNNPFERMMSLTRGGLGSMSPRGGLVAYSTEPGDTATDNGLYTRQLVAALRVPGLPAMELFTRVSEAVSAASGGTQVPMQQLAGVVGRFVFRSGDPLPPGEVLRDCPTCPELVVIPAGRFRMGCVSGRDCQDEEQPVHEVEVGSFALGVHEVTRAEYGAFVSATGRTSGQCYAFDEGERQWGWREGVSWRSPGYPQSGDHPAVCVSWEDAQAYVRWLSTETGARYRLPSEAEWEYGARAGTTTPRHWGNDPDEQCSYANGADRTAKRRFDGWTVADCTDGALWTSPAGSFTANEFGLHDMLGNVWEWVADCWHDDYDGAPRDGSAWTSGADCSRRVLRGGSWVDNPAILRSANRYFNDAGARVDFHGFRVSRTLD